MRTTQNERSGLRRLTARFIAALGALALLALVGHIFVQLALVKQSNDARILNVAGRQRMLSQRLSKATLLLEAATTSPAERRRMAQEELQSAVTLWERSQLGLQRGDAELGLPGINSVEVRQLFARVEPHHQAMLGAAKELLWAAESNASVPADASRLAPHSAQMLAHEPSFLRGMEEIVAQYEREAGDHVVKPKQTHLALLAVTLLVLLLEVLFVFRPAMHKIRRTIMHLKRATKSVRLLEMISSAANEAPSADHALQTSLDLICEHMNWPVGHVYLFAEDSSGELLPTTLWHFDDEEQCAAFRRITEATRLASGTGLPGTVLASGEPAWIADVTRSSNFPRVSQAKEIGIRAGFAFPIMIGTKIVGVMEFFSREAVEPDARLLDAMRHVGTQLGRVIERQQAEAARHQSEERYREVFENANVLVYTHELTITRRTANC